MPTLGRIQSYDPPVFSDSAQILSRVFTKNERIWENMRGVDEAVAARRVCS
jgi:hypothetical protein